MTRDRAYCRLSWPDQARTSALVGDCAGAVSKETRGMCNSRLVYPPHDCRRRARAHALRPGPSKVFLIPTKKFWFTFTTFLEGEDRKQRTDFRERAHDCDTALDCIWGEHLTRPAYLASLCSSEGRASRRQCGLAAVGSFYLVAPELYTLNLGSPDTTPRISCSSADTRQPVTSSNHRQLALTPST